MIISNNEKIGSVKVGSVNVAKVCNDNYRIYPVWNLCHWLNIYPSSGTLTDVRFVTAIESLKHKSVKCLFRKEGESNYTELNLNVAISIKLNGLTLNPYRLFSKKGCPKATGYVCYSDNIVNLLEEHTNYECYFVCEEPDGTILHSWTRRLYKIDTLTRTGLSAEEYDY